MMNFRCSRERFASPFGLQYSHLAGLVEQASLPVLDAQAGKPARHFRLEAEVSFSCALLEQFVVRMSRRFKFDDVRQRFRLTPTERRVVAFVVAAFVLGLVTKCYRDAHPSPTPIQTHSGKSRVSRSSSAKVDQQSARNAGAAARRTR